MAGGLDIDGTRAGSFPRIFKKVSGVNGWQYPGSTWSHCFNAFIHKKEEHKITARGLGISSVGVHLLRMPPNRSETLQSRKVFCA
jgi:hypothetical protein